MTHISSVQPPRIAVWLLDLFTPYEQSESIPGDLFEEFSEVVAKSGVAYARGWYWRQSMRTDLHLVRCGFRAAPWSMAGAVVARVLLVQLGEAFCHWGIVKWIDSWGRHVHGLSQSGMLFYNIVLYLPHLTALMLIGRAIAVACKSREMLVTLALSLVCSIQAVTGFWISVRGWLAPVTKIFTMALQFGALDAIYYFGGLFAIVIGGGVVQKYRLPWE